MPDVIARLFASGGAFLLAGAFIAAGALAAEDDLPDLGEEVERMAAEVALELQRVCPPASPADQAAFDRCRRSLFGDSALRRNLAPRLLWGRRNQNQAATLKDTNLTQFAPDVFAGLYLSLFMFSGEHSVEYVERERMYVIRCSPDSATACRQGSFHIRSGMMRRNGASTRPRTPFCCGSIPRLPRSSSGSSLSAAAAAPSSPRNP